jgi:hypothetical protein
VHLVGFTIRKNDEINTPEYAALGFLVDYSTPHMRPHLPRFYHNTLLFLISNFRHVLNVVCFLLGNSLASEFYMPTFRNTLVCFIFIGRYV